VVECATQYRALHVDFGTGDGAYVRHTAARNPERLVIGVDANAEGLRESSRRIAAKPARGGLPNAWLARLALADAPGTLAGLADGLTVLLPWGSLLRAAAGRDERALRALRALCKPGAELRVLFGYGPEIDSSTIRELGLPALDQPEALLALERAYRSSGFNVAARVADGDAVRSLPTTWAKRLAYSGHERRFVDVTGESV
jgi:16S rRNA (adenine(1408)-N(1))-methyltransferase